MLNNFRRLILPCIISASLVIAGCGGGNDDDNVVAASATVLGKVTDVNGLPLSGVTVTIGSSTATSSTDGSYTLNVPPSTSTVKIEAQKTGFVATLDMVPAIAGQSIPIDFKLQTIGLSNVLTNLTTTNANASDGDGVVVVKFTPNSIVDSAGNPVSTATVDVTTNKPSATGYADSFPGLFVGTRSDSDIAIESFGYANIDISCGTAKCNLGAGKTAEIAIPVTPSADPNTPTIELWSLNTTNGKWQYETDATRDATSLPVVYRANVTHFSAYNLDRPISTPTELKVTVTNNNAPVPSAAVVVTSRSSAGAVWEGQGITGTDGTYTFPVIPQGSVSAKAAFGSLKGTGYGYDMPTAGKATMSIALAQLLSKQIFFYRMVDGVKTPVSGASIQAFGEGQGTGTGGGHFNGFTGADGKLNVELSNNGAFYVVSANATINSISYYANSNTNSFAAIPSEIELTTTSAQ